MVSIPPGTSPDEGGPKPNSRTKVRATSRRFLPKQGASTVPSCVGLPRHVRFRATTTLSATITAAPVKNCSCGGEQKVLYADL